MLTTDQKGAIAEMAIARAALELGVQILRPVGEQRYDLVFDVGSSFVRIQCKSAARKGSVVVVRCGSCKRGPHGMMQRAYTPEEIDAIAVYCAELDRCFLLPIDRFPQRSSIHLRLGPALNNQRRGVVWAEEFAFEATLLALGP